MLRQDKEKHDLVRDQRMAHIKAEADRSDAIEVIYDKEDGQPIIRFRNKTDIFLDYSFDYSIVVGGETRRWQFPSPLPRSGLRPIRVFCLSTRTKAKRGAICK